MIPFQVGERVRHILKLHSCVPFGATGRIVRIEKESETLDVAFEGKLLHNARVNNCWWVGTHEVARAYEEDFE